MADNSLKNRRLEQCFPFQLCAAELIKEIDSMGEVREFSANEIIFPQDAERKHIGLILSGEVLCVCRDDRENSADILFGAENWIGLDRPEKTRYAASFAAYGSCTVFLLEREAFEIRLLDYPELADCMELLTDAFNKQLKELPLIPNVSRFTPILCNVRPHPLYWLAEAILLPALLLLGAFAFGKDVFSAPEKIIPTTLLCFAAGRLLWRFKQQLPHQRLMITQEQIFFYTTSDKPDYVLSIGGISRVRLIPDLGFLFRLPGILCIEKGSLPPFYSFPLSKARIISALLYCLMTDLPSVSSEDIENIKESGDDKGIQPNSLVKLVSVRIKSGDDDEIIQPNSLAKLVSVRIKSGDDDVDEEEEEDDDDEEETQGTIPDAEIFVLKSPEELNREKLVSSVSLPVTYHTHWIKLAHMIRIPILILIFIVTAHGVTSPTGSFSFIHSDPGTVVYGSILFILSLSLVYCFIDWKNDNLRIENDCVRKTSKRPLTKETVSVTFADKIQNVRFSRDGIIQILLNYGTVYVMAGVNEIRFSHVPNPKFVSELILEMQKRHESEEKRKDDERLNQFVSGLANSLYNKRSGRSRPPQTKADVRRIMEERQKRQS